jgi:hypothetical protein
MQRLAVPILDQKQKSPAFLNAVNKSMRAVLRLFERQIEAALPHPKTQRGGAKKNMLLQIYSLRLDESRARELRQHLDGIQEFFDRNHTSEVGDQ